MADLEEDDLKVLHNRLAELGAEHVRQMLASDSFPVGMKMQILKWLADQNGGGKKKKGD